MYSFKMHIVHIATEFAPLCKVGGLGDVVTGLSRELTGLGERVEIILPKYNFVKLNFQVEVSSFYVNEKNTSIDNTMWKAESEDCSLHFLESHHPHQYFNREKIYGYDDDTPRFIYFSKAVVEYLKLKKEPIDVLHLHDWHVSTVALLVKQLYQNEISVKKIILSIHNIEHQGKCASHDLTAIEIPYELTEPLKGDNPHFPETVNLLKAGIIYSDAIVTVSPTYAKEILTPQYGFGLEKILQQNKTKLLGILNGLDAKLWNPETDPFLKQHYTASDSMKKVLNAKQKTKKSIFNSTNQPWIGTISRLVPQKGPELIEEALRKTVEMGGVFIILGSSPIPEIQSHFESLKQSYKDNPNVQIILEYNEELSHTLFAALDFLVVPSHFEPCGLTQMIAMRFGTVPIVRATGGLKDTVYDCEDFSNPAQIRNGFSFQKATKQDMAHTIQRAIHLFKNDPIAFQSLIKHGMNTDFSWKRPAREYLRIYQIKDNQSLLDRFYYLSKKKSSALSEEKNALR